MLWNASVSLLWPTVLQQACHDVQHALTKALQQVKEMNKATKTERGKYSLAVKLHLMLDARGRKLLGRPSFPAGGKEAWPEPEAYLQLWWWRQEAAGEAGNARISKVQRPNALQEAAHRLLLVQRRCRGAITLSIPFLGCVYGIPHLLHSLSPAAAVRLSFQSHTSYCLQAKDTGTPTTDKHMGS